MILFANKGSEQISVQKNGVRKHSNHVSGRKKDFSTWCRSKKLIVETY